jgi:hypothetical protein
MTSWRVDKGPSGLRLAPVVRRALGSEAMTWTELLYGELNAVHVYCLYFPSRFDLPVDGVATESLRTFAAHTGTDTMVDLWDPTDPEFGQALALFGLDAPPALVFVAGLRLKGALLTSPQGTNLYAIAIHDAAVLGDRERLAAATNAAHEVVRRSDPRELAGYLRKQSATALLEGLGKLSGGVGEQILRLKPKFMLPGGISLQLG